jgi:hypothetical protein
MRRIRNLELQVKESQENLLKSGEQIGEMKRSQIEQSGMFETKTHQVQELTRAVQWLEELTRENSRVNHVKLKTE